MLRLAVIYGAVGGVLIAVLRYVEYRWLVVHHSAELYGGLVALTCAGLGVWLGASMRRPPATIAPPAPLPQVAPPAAAVPPPAPAPSDDRGLTAREREILGLIAAGLTNKEIGARLFVSENTVKTHSRRVFEKLGARRRTEAVHVAKTLGLLS